MFVCCATSGGNELSAEKVVTAEPEEQKDTPPLQTPEPEVPLQAEPEPLPPAPVEEPPAAAEPPAPEPPAPEPPAPEPPAPAPAKVSNFTFLLKREEGKTLGLELDVSDGKYACIKKVKEGLVAQYNTGAGDKIVENGDYLVSVNGVGDNSDKIVQAIKDSNELNLNIRKAMTLTVTVTLGDKKLGLGLKPPTKDDTALIVHEVKEGAVSAYNADKPPEGKVSAFARITAVNNATGTPQELLEKLKTPAASISLAVTQPAPA